MSRSPLIALFLAAAAAASASTDLAVANLGVAGSDGTGLPVAGDLAVVTVRWTAPSASPAYVVKVQLGDQSGTINCAGAAGTYEYHMQLPVTSSASTVCSATLDTGNAVDDPNRANNFSSFSFTPASPNSSDLYMVSVKAVGPDGASAPVLGDAIYGTLFQWTVPKASKPYRIKIQMADKVLYSAAQSGAVGTFQMLYNFAMPLDGAIPVTVTLDPDGTASDPNLANNVMSMVFTPTAPSKVVDYYNPAVLTATETMSLAFSSTSKLKQVVTEFGVPLTATSQIVTSLTPVSGATVTTTTPSAQSIYQTNKTSGFTSTLAQSLGFKTQASSMRMNAALVTDTWITVANAASATSMAPYVASETLLPIADARVKAFVAASLPTDYKTSMTPLATARMLFQAVVAKLTYVKPWSGTAADALTAGKGDCGAFSELYAASLRSVGIPSRLVFGWLKGTDQTHVWTEMYLPSTGWIPQDATYSNGVSENGAYAYDFGIVPDLNSRVSVSRASVNNTSLLSLANGLQKPIYGFWISSGTAPTVTNTTHTTLQ